MSVQANWHLEGLELPEGDPLQAIAQLKSGARVIDLTRGEDEVRAEFLAAFQRENDFSVRADLECDLKWTVRGPNGPRDLRNPCYDCPHFTKDHENEARALLCGLGRHQNDLLDTLDALHVSDALDHELAAAFEAEAAAAAELAAALL